MRKKVLLRARVRKFHFWVGIGTSSRENTSDSHHNQHDLSEKQIITLTQCATINHLHENISGFIMHFPDWHSQISPLTAVTHMFHRGDCKASPRWRHFTTAVTSLFRTCISLFYRLQTSIHTNTDIRPQTKS